MTPTWYEASAAPIAPFPTLHGQTKTDVVVVGGGFTGLGAAIELRRQGLGVILLEAKTLGAGGSGRNGGQIHPGQRRDQLWLEQQLGHTDAHALWQLAEAARTDLLATITDLGIDCHVRTGLLHPNHRPGREGEDHRLAEHMVRVYNYDGLQPLDRAAMASALGTETYFEGLRDRDGGHLHPLKLLRGLATAASRAEAEIFEASPALDWSSNTQTVKVRTTSADIIADQLILTGDGDLGGLPEGGARERVATLANYIAVTAPLPQPHLMTLLPGGEAAADSRFVINYWRRTADNRLLFGGGETYGRQQPTDIARFVRRPMLKAYPQLHGLAITHAWGGRVGITMRRMPFVRRLAPRVLISAGYSGQGVVLAPYFGKLLAKAIAGEASGLDLLSRIPAPKFPGGNWLRDSVLAAGLSYYALRDRLG